MFKRNLDFAKRCGFRGNAHRPNATSPTDLRWNAFSSPSRHLFVSGCRLLPFVFIRQWFYPPFCFLFHTTSRDLLLGFLQLTKTFVTQSRHLDIESPGLNNFFLIVVKSRCHFFLHLKLERTLKKTKCAIWQLGRSGKRAKCSKMTRKERLMQNSLGRPTYFQEIYLQQLHRKFARVNYLLENENTQKPAEQNDLMHSVIRPPA